MLEWNSTIRMLMLAGALLAACGGFTVFFALRQIRRIFINRGHREAIRNRRKPILATQFIRLSCGTVMILFGLQLLIQSFNNRWPF